MGSWGPGNFDNDCACDHLYGIVQPLIERVRKTVSNPLDMELDEPTSMVMMCDLEILALIAEKLTHRKKNVITELNYANFLPAKAEIEHWENSIYDNLRRVR